MIQDFETYLEQPERMLRDAVDDPVLAPFIDRQRDLQAIVLTEGGVQRQVMALSGDGARRVVQRIVAATQKAGVDLKEWICGAKPDQFNLCAVFNAVGLTKTMADLQQFLKKKWVKWPATIAGVFLGGLLGALISALSVLGLISDELIEMCGCKP